MLAFKWIDVFLHLFRVLLFLVHTYYFPSRMRPAGSRGQAQGPPRGEERTRGGQLPSWRPARALPRPGSHAPPTQHATYWNEGSLGNQGNPWGPWEATLQAGVARGVRRTW